MPRPYVPEYHPDMLDWFKDFKIPPNKFKPRKKVRTKRMSIKLKVKKEVEFTPEQLRKFKKAKTPEGKMSAVGMRGGTRAVIDIKKKLIERMGKTAHRLDGVRSFSKWSVQRKFTQALADHLAGETIQDAALRYGVTPDKLAHYKKRFLQADSALPQYVEDLFMSAAAECVGMFHDKKHELSAMQTVIAAGIFAERAVQMKKARNTQYQDDVIPLSSLQKLSEVMDRIKEAKLIQGKVIDLPQLPDKSEGEKDE